MTSRKGAGGKKGPPETNKDNCAYWKRKLRGGKRRLKKQNLGPGPGQSKTRRGERNLDETHEDARGTEKNQGWPNFEESRNLNPQRRKCNRGRSPVVPLGTSARAAWPDLEEKKQKGESLHTNTDKVHRWRGYGFCWDKRRGRLNHHFHRAQKSASPTSSKRRRSRNKKNELKIKRMGAHQPEKK